MTRDTDPDNDWTRRTVTDRDGNEWTVTQEPSPPERQGSGTEAIDPKPVYLRFEHGEESRVVRLEPRANLDFATDEELLAHLESARKVADE